MKNKIKEYSVKKVPEDIVPMKNEQFDNRLNSLDGSSSCFVSLSQRFFSKMVKNVHLVDQNLFFSRFLVDIANSFFDDIESVALFFFFDIEFSLIRQFIFEKRRGLPFYKIHPKQHERFWRLRNQKDDSKTQFFAKMLT